MAVTLDYLVVEDAPPAAIITLNRPETLNALSTGLMTELTAELERQAARPEVRAIVLKGSGIEAGDVIDLRVLQATPSQLLGVVSAA
jgi:enoyl-CoA hydratase/carnithine racemase